MCGMFNIRSFVEFFVYADFIALRLRACNIYKKGMTLNSCLIVSDNHVKATNEGEPLTFIQTDA